MTNQMPLKGMRVAAFTHFAAGPIAAQYLGALGADVVKVESPSRDLNRYAVRDLEDSLNGVSPYFLCTNRNQRCLVANLKTDGGLEVARRLIASSDVVLENYRPGVLDKLGLGYKQAKALKNDIIYCSFSAYDSTGPGRDRPGQDLIMQAVSGLASVSGRANGPPVPVGAYLIDGFTAMQGVIGVLAAIQHRNNTGEGQLVRADMMSTALYMMAQEAAYIANTKGESTRSSAGIAHMHQGAPYGIYQALDGYVAISVFGGGDVPRQLAKELGVENQISDYLSETGLKANRDEIARAFGSEIAKISVEQAVKRLNPTGAWVVPVKTVAEALDDPIAKSSGTICDFSNQDAGRHRVVTEPLQMERAHIRRDMAAPGFGEHSEAVLSDLGFDADEVAALLADGSVLSKDSAETSTARKATSTNAVAS